MIDFNNYNDNDLIPARTVAVVQMNLRSGPDYLEGIVKPTKARDAYGLDVEYTVLDGPHAKRKLYGFVLTQGETDGQKSMIEQRSMPFLKGILNSAYYLDPADSSPAACEKRRKELRDFDGLRLLAEVGVEKSKDAAYPDKNVVVRAIRATCRNGATVRRSNRSRQLATAAPQGARSRRRRLRQRPRPPQSPSPPGPRDALQPARIDLGRSR
jgi:hypothetical protein